MSQPALWVIKTNQFASIQLLDQRIVKYHYLINCFHSLLHFLVSFCLFYV